MIRKKISNHLGMKFIEKPEKFFWVLNGTQFPLRKHTLTIFFLDFLTCWARKIRKKISNRFGMKSIAKTKKVFGVLARTQFPLRKNTFANFFLDFLTFLSLTDQKKDLQSIGPEIYRKNGEKCFWSFNWDPNSSPKKHI